MSDATRPGRCGGSWLAEHASHLDSAPHVLDALGPDRILDAVRGMANEVWWVGDTALSRVFLQHRRSDDLGFVFDSEQPFRVAQQLSRCLTSAGMVRGLFADIDGNEFAWEVRVRDLGVPVKVELFAREYVFRYVDETGLEAVVYHDIRVLPFEALVMMKAEALCDRHADKDAIDLLATFACRPEAFLNVLSSLKDYTYASMDLVLDELFQFDPDESVLDKMECRLSVAELCRIRDSLQDLTRPASTPFNPVKTFGPSSVRPPGR